MILQKLQKGHSASKQNEEGKVEGGKHADIILGLSGVVLHVFAEGDQAGQGGDQGTHTTDVDTHQKVGVVFGKLRKQNGRGNVTDDLTAQGTEDQSVLFQEEGEECRAFEIRVFA